LGYIGSGPSARPKTPCKGKVQRRKSLHGNQEKGREEEKETLTVGETLPRMGQKEFSQEAFREKHLPGGFLIRSLIIGLAAGSGIAGQR